MKVDSKCNTSETKIQSKEGDAIVNTKLTKMLNKMVALVFASLLVVAMARSPQRFGNVGLGNVGFPNLGSGSATAFGTGQDFPGGGESAIGFSQSNAANGGFASGSGNGFAQDGFFGESVGGNAQTFSQGK